MRLPTPQEPDPDNPDAEPNLDKPDPDDSRWSVIRYALDSNARTIRFCLIGLVTGVPVSAVVMELIQHIR